MALNHLIDATMKKRYTLKTLTHIITLIISVGLTACASLSIPKQPSDQYIDDLLQDHQFEDALVAVDKWQTRYPNNLDLPKQRQKITRAISLFESNTLKSAHQLDREGKWQDAKSTYENALAHLTSSQPLQNAYSEFSVRRLKYIQSLKEELDVAQAKHWLSISTNINTLYKAAPDDQEANDWKITSKKERDQLAGRLINYGQAHEANKHFGTAALRYDLAYKISPSELTKPYHDRAAKTFADRKATRTERAQENQKRQQSKLDQLVESFDRYLAEDKLQMARQTLNAMVVIDAKKSEVQDRKAILEQRQNIALEEAILEGKRLYTQGEFDSAINIWQRALTLDPDNKELKENIQRAETFRDNLERLKQGL